VRDRVEITGAVIGGATPIVHHEGGRGSESTNCVTECKRRGTRPVDVAWFSTECTMRAHRKGSKERCIRLQATGRGQHMACCGGALQVAAASKCCAFGVILVWCLSAGAGDQCHNQSLHRPYAHALECVLRKPHWCCANPTGAYCTGNTMQHYAPLLPPYCRSPKPMLLRTRPSNRPHVQQLHTCELPPAWALITSQRRLPCMGAN
jgi:hypothetical protein